MPPTARIIVVEPNDAIAEMLMTRMINKVKDRPVIVLRARTEDEAEGMDTGVTVDVSNINDVESLMDSAEATEIGEKQDIIDGQLRVVLNDGMELKKKMDKICSAMWGHSGDSGIIETLDKHDIVIFGDGNGRKGLRADVADLRVGMDRVLKDLGRMELTEGRQWSKIMKVDMKLTVLLAIMAPIGAAAVVFIFDLVKSLLTRGL